MVYCLFLSWPREITQALHGWGDQWDVRMVCGVWSRVWRIGGPCEERSFGMKSRGRGVSSSLSSVWGMSRSKWRYNSREQYVWDWLMWMDGIGNRETGKQVEMKCMKSSCVCLHHVWVGMLVGVLGYPTAALRLSERANASLPKASRVIITA